MSTQTDCDRIFNRNGLMGLDLENVEVKEEIEAETEADCNSNNSNSGNYMHQAPNTTSITCSESIGHHVQNEMSLPPDENDRCSVVSIKDEIVDVDPVVEMDIAAEPDSLFVPDILVHFSSSDPTRHLPMEPPSMPLDTPLPLSLSRRGEVVEVTEHDRDAEVGKGTKMKKRVVIYDTGIGPGTVGATAKKKVIVIGDTGIGTGTERTKTEKRVIVTDDTGIGSGTEGTKTEKMVIVTDDTGIVIGTGTVAQCELDSGTAPVKDESESGKDGCRRDVGKAKTRSTAMMSGSKNVYTTEDLDKAVEDVQLKRKNLAQAAFRYNVPRSTLRDKVSGRYAEAKCKTVLTKQEEEKLVDRVKMTSARGCGMTKQELAIAVQRILNAEGRKNPFANNLPGRSWFRCFFSRHPDIKLRKTKMLEEESTTNQGDQVEPDQQESTDSEHLSTLNETDQVLLDKQEMGHFTFEADHQTPSAPVPNVEALLSMEPKSNGRNMCLDDYQTPSSPAFEFETLPPESVKDFNSLQHHCQAPWSPAFEFETLPTESVEDFNSLQDHCQAPCPLRESVSHALPVGDDVDVGFKVDMLIDHVLTCGWSLADMFYLRRKQWSNEPPKTGELNYQKYLDIYNSIVPRSSFDNLPVSKINWLQKKKTCRVEAPRCVSGNTFNEYYEKKAENEQRQHDDAEAQKIEKERKKTERGAQKKAEKESGENDRAEAKKIEKERQKTEKQVEQKAEMERRKRDEEAEKIERQRQKAEREAQRKAEKEREKRGRAEAKKIEKERLKAEKETEQNAEMEKRTRDEEANKIEGQRQKAEREAQSKA